MNHIANSLISALGLARRDQAASARHNAETSPMRQLSSQELRGIVGGDDQTGPRGGWKAAAVTVSV